MGIRDIILCLETQGVFVLPATWIYFSADVKIVGCYFLPSPLFFFRLSVCQWAHYISRMIGSQQHQFFSITVCQDFTFCRIT